MLDFWQQPCKSIWREAESKKDSMKVYFTLLTVHKLFVIHIKLSQLLKIIFITSWKWFCFYINFEWTVHCKRNKRYQNVKNALCYLFTATLIWRNDCLTKSYVTESRFWYHCDKNNMQIKQAHAFCSFCELKYSNGSNKQSSFTSTWS